MRVVYFNADYHRYTGAQRSLQLLVTSIRDHGVNPLVVFPGDGVCVERYREAGIETRVLPAPAGVDVFGGGLLRAGPLTRARRFAADVTPYAREVSRLLTAEGAALGHFNNLRALLLAGGGARIAGIPAIWHLRGRPVRYGATYLHAAGALATRVISVAQALVDDLPRWIRPRCRVVHNGIAPPPDEGGRSRRELLASLPTPLDLDPAAALVVVVGTVTPFKGAHHVVQAARQLSAADPSFRRRVGFVFVGDRPDDEYAAYLDGLVRRLPGRNVGFAGWDDRPLDWMRAADLHCLPTVLDETLMLSSGERRLIGTEGFSRSVLEAMASGLPVVAADVPGVREQVVDGETGTVVAPSSPSALARAIGALASDPARRKRMGRAARDRVHGGLTLGATAEGVRAVYRELEGEDASAVTGTVGRVRQRLGKLRVLADPGFYAYLARTAIPDYWERRRAGIRVGRGGSIHATARITRGDRLTLGAGASIGADCDIRPSSAGVEVGARAMVAQSVHIIGSNYDVDDGGQLSDARQIGRRVVLGDDCWVGCRAVILPGVTVGEGAVVAAGSVVNRDVPPRAIVAGVPARVVRERRRPLTRGEPSQERPLKVAHVAMGVSAHLILERIMVGLQQRGHDVVAICNGDEWGRAVQDAGVPVAPASFPRGAPVWGTLKALIQAAGQIARLKPDVVHTHNSVSGVLVRPLARVMGVPHVIHTCHGWAFRDDQPAWRRWPILGLEWVAGRSSSLLMFQGHEALDAARRHGLAREDRLAWIGNGIDLGRFRDVEERPTDWDEVLRGRRVVVKVARFEPIKNHELFLDALALVRQTEDVAALLVGYGTHEDHVRNAVRARNLQDHVVFAGYRRDIAGVLALADVAALTSRKEGMPRSLIEAMVCRVPVVATDVPGTREVVFHEETGLLVPDGDAPGFAAAILRLLGDAVLRARVVETAHARAVADHDEGDVVDRMDALYRRLSGRSGPATKRPTQPSAGRTVRDRGRDVVGASGVEGG